MKTGFTTLVSLLRTFLVTVMFLNRPVSETRLFIDKIHAEK